MAGGRYRRRPDLRASPPPDDSLTGQACLHEQEDYRQGQTWPLTSC